jgi:hypothetical protein
MWVNINVDVGEIYNELSDREKHTLLDWLEDDGISSYGNDDNAMSISPMREDWSDTCIKLSHLYYRMTNEEQEAIEKIVKKYL